MALTKTKSGPVRVEVAADKLSASLKVMDKHGASSLGQEAIMDLLAGAEVEITEAVEAKVVEFVEMLTASEPPKEPFVVAEGEPAENGQDEQIVWSEVFQKQSEEWKDDAKTDFYEASAIVTIEKDTVIGTITPIVQPREGRNVKGEILKPEGNPAQIDTNDTIRRGADNPLQLLSNVAGRVIQKGRSLRVSETLVINGDVGFDTGNVHSKVEVHIKGRIPDRFKAESEKSITVGGSIEAAEVTAAGDIVVRRGILGRRYGLVTAGNQITAKFCADANLVSGGNLKIAKQLMNCQACVCGKVEAPGASIVGGCIYAKMGLEAANIGSEANVPTRIVVGVEPHVIREIAHIIQTTQRSEHLIKGIQELIEPMLKKKDFNDPEQKKKAEELLGYAAQCRMKIERDAKRKKELAEQVWSNESAGVIGLGTIYRRVRICIGERETVFQNDLKGPILIEKRKVNNVTELVAVNRLTASVKVLKSERRHVEDLLEGFELEQEEGRDGRAHPTGPSSSGRGHH